LDLEREDQERYITFSFRILGGDMLVCGHCGSKTLYNSYWNRVPNISCFICGGTEDDAYGILRNGKRTFTSKNLLFTKVKEETEENEEDAI
jgi:ferredoxin